MSHAIPVNFCIAALVSGMVKCHKKGGLNILNENYHGYWTYIFQQYNSLQVLKNYLNVNLNPRTQKLSSVDLFVHEKVLTFEKNNDPISI